MYAWPGPGGAWVPSGPCSGELNGQSGIPGGGGGGGGGGGSALGVGRLLASCCSHLDLFHLRGLNQGGKLRLAQGRLQDPDVQWTLVVVRDFGGDKASVRLANVTGRGKAQVRFRGRIDTESPFGATTLGTARCVGADGLIDELSNFLNGQQSKMQVHIAVHHSSASAEGLHGDDLNTDLAKLLDQGVLSDVVLQVQAGGKAKGAGGADGRTDIRAHKAVLAARSPVFQRLFLSDMAESRTSTVAVDFPAAVMEHVLRYAYTGRVDLGGEAQAGESQGQGQATAAAAEVGKGEDSEAVTAMAVLAAADYYQLAGLKRLCEERLLQRVGLVPEEALHTVVLSDRYGARALKEAALNVAADHLRQLRQRPEWGDFARHHHDLVAELMGVLADKLDQAQATLAQHVQGQATNPDAAHPPLSDASPAAFSLAGLHGGAPNDVFGHIFVGAGAASRAVRFP